MTRLDALYAQAIRALSKLTCLGPLLARITIGIVFIESGWGKLHNLPKVIGYFESLGIPAAQYQAPFVAGTEFFAGALVLIGLVTRLASIPLSAIMLVAIITAKSSEINTWSDVFGFSEFLYLVLLIWLIVEGAGALSADAVIARMRGFNHQRERH